MKSRVHPTDPLFDAALNEALLTAQALLLPPPERQAALRERVLAGVTAAPLPASVEHLTVRGLEGDWLPLMPGIHIKLLREDVATRSYLLRMAPGARLPAHGHSHEEECLVLEGDVWLDALHAHAGDYHLARSGRPHGVVRSDGGCLLFLRGQKEYAAPGTYESYVGRKSVAPSAA